MNKTVIDKKLNYISSKLDASSARSPATFDPDSFSEQEKILFAKVGEILGKNTSGVYPYRVPLEDAELVNKACKIVVCSAMELFTFVIPRWFGGGEVDTWFFDQYFCNFMFDYMECLKTVYKRSEKEREDFLRYLKENDKLNTIYRIRPCEPEMFGWWAISLGWDDMRKSTKKKSKKGEAKR